MYNDEIYSVRYAFDPIYNQETGYDYYSGAPSRIIPIPCHVLNIHQCRRRHP